VKITIPYFDYLNKKVCASEYVDYETNTLKPDAEGMVEVKHRLKRKRVPVEEVELVDLHPDYRLSEEVRRIPFVNYTDSKFLVESLKRTNCWNLKRNQQRKLSTTVRLEMIQSYKLS
jgi:hypothetical protein